jgi:acyl dehydratase
MTEFDPAGHRMVSEQRWFEDFVLGERFVIPSRTMTSAVFAAFQTASGDTHPIHYDFEYCRARGMPNLLAHGFQTLVHTAPGAGLFPFMVEESLVGFLEQSSRFLKPVFADDTIYPALEVTELVPGRLPAWSPCAVPCSISGASWCWRECRNFLSGEGLLEARRRESLPHSITSSASASRFGDTSMPSALAVLRLITSSNLVGCITGISAGLAPFRIWPL